MAEAAKRYAVVTGGNKGIGFGICKQLAFNGIVVVLTARDPKGHEAVDKLGSESGVSGQLVFHQFDVIDPANASSLANFIRTKFEKLDILVNNAGIHEVHVDRDDLVAAISAKNMPSGWAKEVLRDAENLTEKKLDEVMKQFLEDIKEGSLETKGWSPVSSAYMVSKACMNAYTRILSNKYPSFYINAVCPGCENRYKAQHWSLDCG